MGRIKLDPDNPNPAHYRAFFLYWMKPPYTCGYCSEIVDETIRPFTNEKSLVIHHIDFDHANITLDNLMPLHRKCHPPMHITGMRRSDESRQRMSDAQQKLNASGRVPSFTGRQHTDETKDRISRKALERARQPVVCPQCGDMYPVHNLPGHVTSAHTDQDLHSEEGKRRLREVAKARMDNLIWCEECRREWTVLLWPRHIRKYHEGGSW